MKLGKFVGDLKLKTVGRVEKLVAEYGDTDGAAKELAKLIAEDDTAHD